MKTIPAIYSCLQSDNPSIYSMFRAFDLKMEEQGMPAIVINVFRCYYGQLIYGAQGKITENEITPLGDEDVVDYAGLEKYRNVGTDALSRAVVIKLNGGLGTSMGLEKAKSLITVKDGLTFLDLILRQMHRLREKHNIQLPLCFMNSFKTHRDTMTRAEGFNNGTTDIPMAFVQHRYPKVLEVDFSPAVWPENPELEWNPPGHGDIYTALVTSKLLTKLLRNGFNYAFVSNSDNLGAVMDERLLGFMVKENLPFVMEVARRTSMDSKGGHLARLKRNGRLALREYAQCPEKDKSEFSDIEKHRFFNTNSIWLDLRVVEKVFVAHHMMPLDLIINPKTIDPRDPDSPRVLQLETAMGSAISAFETAAAVCVPRSRFAPVKTTNDLCLIMSDCYTRSPDETVIPSPARELPLPEVKLDPMYFKKIDDFQNRFSSGVPSLVDATSLSVEGDVRFEEGVAIKGDARVANKFGRQKVVPAGSVVTGELVLE